MRPLLLLCGVLLAITQAQDAHAIDEQQSSSAAPSVDTSSSADSVTEDSTWEVEKRRLAELAQQGEKGRVRAAAGRRTGKRKKKKSWMSLMGVGGDDEATGKAKP